MKKLFATFAVLAALAAPSFAQPTANLYGSNGGYMGQVRAYQGSHFEIYSGNSVIKTFSNTASTVSSNGVPGVQCTIGRWVNGRHVASGYGQFYQNGVVYLRWTNDATAGVWRNIDSGWMAYNPR